MKKVGIIGGIGPSSTIDYYNGIISDYQKIDSNKYPEIFIYSIDMFQMVKKIENEEYESLSKDMYLYSKALKKAGASFMAIASNSPHIIYQKTKVKTCLPVINLVDSVCEYVLEKKYRKVLILATSFTMKNGLYSKAFKAHNIDSITPSQEDIIKVGNIIFPNLENGIIIKEDKKEMIKIAESYIKEYGCDAVLLGCTEIPLMIKDGDLSVDIINSTLIHVKKIGEEILK